MRKQKDRPGPWVKSARCRDIGDTIFYPPDEGPVPRDFYSEAKLICKRCSVCNECLEYGMDEDYGVWGGTSPVERRILRNQVQVARALR